MLILDNFLYNGEPITYLRLKYLYDYVDKFIIVENLYTYTGKKKDDYYYNINKEQFKKFEDKIIFIPMDEHLPTGEDYNRIINIINYVRYIELKDSWIADMYHRDYIQKKIRNLFNNEEFIMFVCDVDEIPKRDFYKYVKNDYHKLDNGVHLEMIYLIYGFNWRRKKLWYQPFVINDKGANMHPFSLLRLTNWNVFYKNIGWHISYYSSIKDIVRKLESFAHTEYDTNNNKNEEYIKKCINEGIVIYDKTDEVIRITNEELPENYKEYDKELRDMNLI